MFDYVWLHCALRLDVHLFEKRISKSPKLDFYFSSVHNVFLFISWIANVFIRDITMKHNIELNCIIQYNKTIAKGAYIKQCLPFLFYCLWPRSIILSCLFYKFFGIGGCQKHKSLNHTSKKDNYAMQMHSRNSDHNIFV